MAAWRYDFGILRVLYERLKNADDDIASDLARAVQAGQNVAARVTALENSLVGDEGAFSTLQGRVTANETAITALQTSDAKQLTITVVADIGSLPASAGVRQWFRVQGNPDVFVGNGAGQPLSRITTQLPLT